MNRPLRHVTLMLDLRWPYKRHAEIYAGIQRCAEERGWVTVIDEFSHDTLRRKQRAADRYDGIIARAKYPLARHAAVRGVAVVNVWPSSPARHLLPGVFPDSTAVGRVVAEHLLARGFRAFATLTSPKNADNESEVNEFTHQVREAEFGCASGLIPQHPYRDLARWKNAVRLIDRATAAWRPPRGAYVGQEGVRPAGGAGGPAARVAGAGGRGGRRRQEPRSSVRAPAAVAHQRRDWVRPDRVWCHNSGRSVGCRRAKCCANAAPFGSGEGRFSTPTPATQHGRVFRVSPTDGRVPENTIAVTAPPAVTVSLGRWLSARARVGRVGQGKVWKMWEACNRG